MLFFYLFLLFLHAAIHLHTYARATVQTRGNDIPVEYFGLFFSDITVSLVQTVSFVDEAQLYEFSTGIYPTMSFDGQN